MRPHPSALPARATTNTTRSAAGYLPFDREELAARGFAASQRGDLTLITPTRAKFDWAADELMLRSVLVDAEGRIVSMGFPKFFNYGENKSDTAVLEKALAAGDEVWMAEKMDGSLCIRSVIDGQVVLRTRGTADGGDHGPAMRRVASRLHPSIMDPEFHPEGSLLFEFTSPAYRIVLNYPEDGLTFLGAVDHADGRMATPAELERIAADGGLTLVAERTLPRDPEALLAEIKDLEGSEGIVARCNDGQTLVKVKSAAYLTAHALRFSFSARKVAELCLEKDLRDEDAFRDQVRQLAGGYDFELEDLVIGHFRAVEARRAANDALLNEVAVWVDDHRHLERKDFALAAKEQGGRNASLYFSILDGRRERAIEYLDKEMIAAVVSERSVLEPDDGEE